MTMKALIDDVLGSRQREEEDGVADFYRCWDCGSWFTHLQLLRSMRQQAGAPWPGVCACGSRRFRLANYHWTMLFSLRYWRYRQVRKSYDRPSDIPRGV